MQDFSEIIILFCYSELGKQATGKMKKNDDKK